MMNLKTTKFVDQSVVIQTCIEYMLFAHDLVPFNPISPKCFGEGKKLNTLKEKNLLQQKRILSLKIRSH